MRNEHVQQVAAGAARSAMSQAFTSGNTNNSSGLRYWNNKTKIMFYLFLRLWIKYKFFYSIKLNSGHLLLDCRTSVSDRLVPLSLGPFDTMLIEGSMIVRTSERLWIPFKMFECNSLERRCKSNGSKSDSKFLIVDCSNPASCLIVPLEDDSKICLINNRSKYACPA